MKKRDLPVVLLNLVATLAALLLLVPIVYGESGYFAVTGRVIDHSGRLLQNVKVELVGKGVTFTDKDGKYAFEDVPPGDYVIKFSKAGFLTFSRYGTLDNSSGTVAGAELFTRAQLQDFIGPWDSAKGIIIGEVSAPEQISGAGLRTEPQVGQVTYLEEGGVSESGFKIPGTSGLFVVRNVMPGQYTISLEHPTLKWTTRGISVSPDEVSFVEMFIYAPAN
ncbi:MAG: carboxypeptidase-like regulatory domain-containing protein [Firmicutes bacterium]|nr:carboxypeptidase-like regulatory domain-containing protein [Bacillota bacterium]